MSDAMEITESRDHGRSPEGTGREAPAADVESQHDSLGKP